MQWQSGDAAGAETLVYDIIFVWARAWRSGRGRSWPALGGTRDTELPGPSEAQQHSNSNVQLAFSQHHIPWYHALAIDAGTLIFYYPLLKTGLHYVEALRFKGMVALSFPCCKLELILGPCCR